jgi:hypothetical protein
MAETKQGLSYQINQRTIKGEGAGLKGKSIVATQAQ